MDIKLNFINNSNDLNNSQIVIFQKNVASDAAETAVAWKVIQNCGPGENHPFTFPLTAQASSGDSSGNCTPQLEAAPGQLLTASQTGSGDVLTYSGASSSATEVQIRNALPVGSINANIYKSGRLLATRTSLAPEQTAVFQFKPTIWIGFVSQVEEGEVMNAAIVSDVNAELSLLGIASADIVMTGGGAGPNAQPFAFRLENIVMA